MKCKDANSWEFICSDKVLIVGVREAERETVADKSLLTSSIVLMASTGAFEMEERAKCCICPAMTHASCEILLAVLLLLTAVKTSIE